MAHQIMLTDEDYGALEAAAKRTGEPIESLLREAIISRFLAPRQQPSGSYQYPTGAPRTNEEEAAMERLAQEIGSDRPWASEMAIEDRGPR